MIAFGKLGGRELNYSSDIDLMGLFAGGARPDAEGAAARLMETLRADLSSHTVEGYAYRVDLRLRPYGSSGQLVFSVDALSGYYLRSAALWETQALLKARPVAGDPAVGTAFLDATRGLLTAPHARAEVAASIDKLRKEALRGLARSILSTTTDIKTGLGGLRDVEFLAQGLLLVHAHERPEILRGGTLPALRALGEAGHPAGDDGRAARRRLHLPAQGRAFPSDLRGPPDAQPAPGPGAAARTVAAHAGKRRNGGAAPRGARRAVPAHPGRVEGVRNTMTSRERVLAAVNHRTPDRVPIDLGGMKASGIAIGAYQGVRDALGLEGPTRVIDPRFMIADVQEDVLRRFGCDVLPLDATMVSAALAPESDWVRRRLFSGREALFPPDTGIEEDPDGSWVLLDADGKRTSFRMPRGGHYFDDTAFNTPGSTIDPWQFRPVAEVPAAILRDMETMSRRLTEDTEYALLGWGYGVCFLGLSLITDRRSNVTMGLPDQWMMMLLTEKETCHEMMGRSVDATIACLRADEGGRG